MTTASHLPADDFPFDEAPFDAWSDPELPRLEWAALYKEATLIPLYPWDFKDTPTGRSRGKTPIHSGWHTRPYNSEDVLLHAEPSRQNIGLRLDREIVVDLDPRTIPGDDSPHEKCERTVDALNKCFGLDLRATLHAYSGGGGRHYFLLKPEGFDGEIHAKLKEFPGVDIKKKVGYMVCAGSKHPDGPLYRPDGRLQFDPLDGSPLAAARGLMHVVSEAFLAALAKGETTQTAKGETTQAAPRAAAAAASESLLAPERIRELLASADPEALWGDNSEWFRLTAGLAHAVYGQPYSLEIRDAYFEWCGGHPDYEGKEGTSKRNADADRWDGLGAKAEDRVSAGTVVEILQRITPRVGGVEQFSARKRPSITISGGQRDALVNEVVEAVRLANDPPRLFRSGGFVVLAHRGEEGEIKLREQTSSRFLETTAGLADYVRPNAKGDLVAAKLPATEAGAVLERLVKVVVLPCLRGIVRHPILRPDGSILQAEGYDAATGLYLDMGGEPLALDVPEHPTAEDVKREATALSEVIADFPFVDEGHRANALSMVLTIPLRELIDGPVPLFAIDAPEAGSGKGLLMRSACVLARGSVPGPFVETDSEEEWRKRIMATLKQCPDVIVVDNLEKPLRSSTLASLLTEGKMQDRILGVSEIAELLHRATWIVAGNNIDIRGDLVRRTVWIRLDAQQARPDERSDFRHPDLFDWIKRERTRLLSAAFTLGRAWIQAGRPEPQGLPTFGSFERWVEVLGGVLEIGGVRGLLDNRPLMFETLHEGNRERGPFLAAVRKALGPQPFTAKRLADALDGDPTLREALPEEIDPTDRAKLSRALGNALRKWRNKRHPCEGGSVWVEPAGVVHGGLLTWRIQLAQSPEPYQVS